MQHIAHTDRPMEQTFWVEAGIQLSRLAAGGLQRVESGKNVTVRFDWLRPPYGRGGTQEIETTRVFSVNPSFVQERP